MIVEFYSVDLAEDSDPDPTWRLEVDFPDMNTGILRMIRVAETLFNVAPISFSPSPLSNEVRIEVFDGDEHLGVLYLTEEES